MEAEGPVIESLTRRLAECPADFLDADKISVVAIAADQMRAMGVRIPEPLRETRNAAHLLLVSIVCWLMHDDWFLSRPALSPQMHRLLNEGLEQLAAIVPPGEFVSDPDRREELARLCLAQLGLRPQGESLAQAKDRMTALDSVERVRVLRDTREAEARAQEVRRVMAKRAAEEAAAKATRE